MAGSLATKTKAFVAVGRDDTAAFRFFFNPLFFKISIDGFRAWRLDALAKEVRTWNAYEETRLIRGD